MHFKQNDSNYRGAENPAEKTQAVEIQFTVCEELAVADGNSCKKEIEQCESYKDSNQPAPAFIQGKVGVVPDSADSIDEYPEEDDKKEQYLGLCKGRKPAQTPAQQETGNAQHCEARIFIGIPLLEHLAFIVLPPDGGIRYADEKKKERKKNPARNAEKKPCIGREKWSFPQLQPVLHIPGSVFGVLVVPVCVLIVPFAQN